MIIIIDQIHMQMEQLIFRTCEGYHSKYNYLEVWGRSVQVSTHNAALVLIDREKCKVDTKSTKSTKKKKLKKIQRPV